MSVYDKTNSVAAHCVAYQVGDALKGNFRVSFVVFRKKDTVLWGLVLCRVHAGQGGGHPPE